MKVVRFTVRILTGETGTLDPVRFCFNGHVMPFEETTGETAPGGVFRGTFAPYSFAHHLSIEGPVSGAWDIEEIDVTYEIEGRDPYDVHLGAVTLDGDTCVDIWRERPIEAFDV